MNGNVPEMDARNKLIHQLQAAQQMLIETKQTAMEANSLAMEVPAIQRVDAMAKECGDLMRQVSRMRW